MEHLTVSMFFEKSIYSIRIPITVFCFLVLSLSTKTLLVILPRDHFTHLFGHQSLVFFFSNSEMDTLSTGKKNLWFVAFVRNENVREPCSKAIAIGIFPMNHIKRTRVSLYW